MSVEPRFQQAAENLWRRFKINGGDGISLEQMAQHIQDAAYGEITELKARIAERDVLLKGHVDSLGKLNAKLLDLSADKTTVQAPPDVVDTRIQEDAAAEMVQRLTPPKKRGRPAKTAPHPSSGAL
jgi:hypothetical protein